MAAILDTGTERLSNSESPCHPNASHQVLAQSDLLYIPQMPPTKFWLNLTYGLEGDVV